VIEKKNTREIIIVGGGPAGLSAALWCAELRMRTILFEKEANFGGQLLSIYNPITNYIGLATKNGREMRDHFINTLEKTYKKESFITRLQAEVAQIDAANKTVILKSGERFSAKALIIATGVRRRKLCVPGEDVFRGKGIIESGAKEKKKVKNRVVAIVGGGDAALENALILSEYAEKIYVIHRRADFRARAEFVNETKNNPKIDFRLSSVVRKFAGTCELNAVEAVNSESGKHEKIDVDFALIRIGVEPNTEFLGGNIDLDENGYVIVDHLSKTSVNGIFAVGDVANPAAPTIAGAVGTAATATKTVFELLNRGLYQRAKSPKI